MALDLELPIEPAQVAFTQLGQALLKYNSALELHALSLEQANASVNQFNARQSVERTDQPDPISDRYRRERLNLQEQERAAALTSSILGEGSVGTRATSEVAQLKKKLLDVQEAYDRGLIDLTDTERELKKLNRQLAIAQGKQAMHGSNPEGSRWGKMAEAAAPAIRDTVWKGVQATAGQIAGVGTGSLGLLASSLPVAGGLGAFGLMLWGFKEADRMKAEFGELANIAVAAGGSAHAKGLSWMAGFQEKAQKFYGIARHEVQRVFKDFVDAGISLDDTFKVIDRSLGEAGENAISLGLAADKHFELSAGATSRAAIQTVQQYGLELGKATVLITDVEFAAHHAGFGVGSFVAWTIQASANTRNLGVGIEEVASAALSMRKHYQSKGVDSESYAKDSVQQMLSGIEGMGVGREFWLSEQLGLGSEIEGRNRLRDGLLRKDPAMLHKIARVFRKDAVQAGGGSEAISRFYLEKLGFGFEGARAIMTIGSESDDDAKLQDKKAADRRSLKNAFAEESQKVSDLEKKKNELLAGFAKAGQGLLQMLTGAMATVVVGVKGIPYFFVGEKDEAQAAFDMMAEQMRFISRGAKTFLVGSEQSVKAVWSTIAPLIDPMIKAWDFNPYISHLSKDELSAFDEKDPYVRRDKIAALLAKYDALTPEAYRKLYERTDLGEHIKFDITLDHPVPLTSAPKPANAQPTTASVPIAPAPVRIEVGGKPMILGSNIPKINIKTEWLAPPGAKDLVVDVRYG